MAKIKKRTVTLNDGSIVILRSPAPSDVKAFINYCEDIFSTSPYVITESDEFKPDIKKQEKWIKNFNNKLSSICIIAEYEGLCIGNLDFRSNEKRRRLSHRGTFGMGVRSNWRGKGIGRLLIKELLKWGKQADNPIEKIELIVLEKNIPAKSLYDSLGFKEEGRIIKEVKLPTGEYIDGINMGLFL